MENFEDYFANWLNQLQSCGYDDELLLLLQRHQDDLQILQLPLDDLAFVDLLDGYLSNVEDAILITSNAVETRKVNHVTNYFIKALREGYRWKETAQ